MELNKLLPLPTRLFYGGFTEELLLRWGLMTLLVWAAWRLFQKRQGEPRSVYFIGAIIVSSVIFGLGHLPFLFALVSDPSVALVLYVIAGNATFGLIAGYLYWKKGLESAMIAHMLAHVVMLIAIFFGVLRLAFSILLPVAFATPAAQQVMRADCPPACLSSITIQTFTNSRRSMNHLSAKPSYVT